MQDKKQQLELDLGEWTTSKLGKEYVKVVYYHPPYITYMQSGDDLVAKSCPTLVTPWSIAHQAPLFMGFPRQDY